MCRRYIRPSGSRPFTPGRSRRCRLRRQGLPGCPRSLVSPSPPTLDLGFAAGWAYLKGGAVEKGRGMLIESALNALEIGQPKATTAMASGLVACGEPGLALDLYRAVLAAAPAGFRGQVGSA